MPEFFRLNDSSFRILDRDEIIKDGDFASEEHRDSIWGANPAKGIGLSVALSARAFREHFVYRITSPKILLVELPRGYRILPIGYYYDNEHIYLGKRQLSIVAKMIKIY